MVVVVVMVMVSCGGRERRMKPSRFMQCIHVRIDICLVIYTPWSWQSLRALRFCFSPSSSLFNLTNSPVPNPNSISNDTQSFCPSDSARRPPRVLCPCAVQSMMSQRSLPIVPPTDQPLHQRFHGLSHATQPLCCLQTTGIDDATTLPRLTRLLWPGLYSIPSATCPAAQQPDRQTGRERERERETGSHSMLACCPA